MKKYIILFILILFFSCEKLEFGLGGEAQIEGRVLIPDTITNQFIPLPGVEIRLGQNPENSANFLFSTKSDEEGFFNFKRLLFPNDTVVYLFATFTRDGLFDKRIFSDREVIRYQEETTTYKVNLELQPDVVSGPHLLSISVQYEDLLSKQLLTADQFEVSYNSTDNPISQFTNSNNGVSIISGIKSGQYTLKVKHSVSYQNQNFSYEKDTLVTLTNAKFNHLVHLKSRLNTPRLAIIELVGLDGITPRRNINYCLYNSAAIQNILACDSTNFTGTSNEFGKAIISPVIHGEIIYITSIQQIDTTALIKKASFQVTGENPAEFKWIID